MKQVIEKILGGWPGGQKITNEPVLSNFKFGNLKVLLYDDDVTKCVF